MRKNINLQPWLDYFAMLRTYEKKGYLEVAEGKHEAYVTRSALLSMAPGSGTPAELADTSAMVAARRLTGIARILRRIRAYAGWRSREGKAYLGRPFALHVVGEDHPHDLLYTLLATRRRAWWKLWMEAERIEVIDYKGKE